MTKPLAFTYVRFSSEKQAQGASLARQLEKATKYAAKHDLKLDDTTYRDLGVSAFRGKNAIEGKLGVFIAAVESGRIPRGSYLLVESFDRMSRNVVSEAQALLLNLVNRGITVVTLLDENVFSKETIDGDDGAYKMIVSVLEMVRARNESKRKSGLVLDGWDKARKHKKIITRMAPAWLSTEDGENWIIDKARAKVIKSIFKMALVDGIGTPTIARRLDAAHVPTFGSAECWTAGVVAHILRNKAVMGTLETPKIGTRDEYYPAIIDRETFETVGSLLQKRNFAPGPRDDGNIGNIFAGRSYCGLCGARMKSVSQSDSGLYIHCDKAYRGNGSCDARRVAYTAFEHDILLHLINAQHRSLLRLSDEIAFDPSIPLRSAVEAKEREIEKLLDYLLTVEKSEILAGRVRKVEAELAELKEKLRKAVPVPKTTEVLRGLLETYHRYLKLEDTAKTGEEYKELRRTLQIGLRNAVAKVEFHQKPGDGSQEHYRVTFLSGTVRERTYRRTPKGFQPGNKNGKR